MELDSETKTDIPVTAQTEILAYAYAAGGDPIEVLARVRVTGLGGTGGTYLLDWYLNGVRLLPGSQIEVVAGVTSFLASSRAVPLVAGDAVSIRLTGVAGDVSVTTLTTLRDVTAARASELYGGGAVLVDHDYGAADALRYVTPASEPIAAAEIRAFLAEDYAAGRRGTAYVVGRTTTKTDGRWRTPMFLDAGAYTLVFHKPKAYGPNVVELTVTT